MPVRGGFGHERGVGDGDGGTARERGAEGEGRCGVDRS